MKRNITVAIHQPNFFPWMGYFDKIAKSNIFIFLDNVQHEKGSGTWGNRVKFLINGESKWVTAPINREYSGTKKIKDISFSENLKWREKILRNILFNYKNHPFFDEYFQTFESLILCKTEKVSDYNINTITNLLDLLDIKNISIFRSSDFKIDKSSNELLIELIKTVGGNHYLSGGGDSTYLNGNLFKEENIIIKKQNFSSPSYKQFKNVSFIPGLSIFDCIFNIGIEETRKLIID